MKVPWWAIPGVAAIVLTTALVSAAEGSLGSPRVALPREVQLSAPAAENRTVPISPTSLPTVTAPSGNVVTPSRPVITQTGTAGSGGIAKTPASDVLAPGNDDPSPSPAPAADGGAVPTTLPVATPTTVAPPPGGNPTSVTTTTQPVPPTTTTTTRPPWGGQHGDE
jgi:hypothetical protein